MLHIKEAISMYFNKSPLILLICITVVFPLQVIEYFAVIFTNIFFTLQGIPELGLLFSIFIVISLFNCASLPFIWMASHDQLNEQYRVRDVYLIFIKRFLPVFFMTFIILLTVLPGMLLFIIPGILLLSMVFLYPYCNIIDQKTGQEALRQAFLVGKRRAVDILFILIFFICLSVLIYYITVMAASFISNVMLTYIILRMIINIIFIPLFVYVFVINYYNWTPEIGECNENGYSAKHNSFSWGLCMEINQSEMNVGEKDYKDYWIKSDGTEYEAIKERRSGDWVIENLAPVMYVLFVITYPLYYIIVGVKTRTFSWTVYGCVQVFFMVGHLILLFTQVSQVLQVVLFLLVFLGYISAWVHFINKRKIIIEKVDVVKRANESGRCVNSFDEKIYAIRRWYGYCPESEKYYQEYNPFGDSTFPYPDIVGEPKRVKEERERKQLAKEQLYERWDSLQNHMTIAGLITIIIILVYLDIFADIISASYSIGLVLIIFLTIISYALLPILLGLAIQYAKKRLDAGLSIKGFISASIVLIKGLLLIAFYRGEIGMIVDRIMELVASF